MTQSAARQTDSKHETPQTTRNGSNRKEQPSNSYTMGCPPVRGDNPRALASGLSYVQVDKHGITILYHLHQCTRVVPESRRLLL